MAIKDIPLNAQQIEKLTALGFDEKDINNQTLIDITLWKQALNGNITALNTVKRMLESKEEEPEEENYDITAEVAKEEKKILKTLNKLTTTQKEINKELIHNIAFQSVTLRHLADDIAKNGVKEKYKNGANQWGYKDRAEVKTYNNMIKSYQSCMKQINDLIINTYGTGEFDEFDEFNK